MQNFEANAGRIKALENDFMCIGSKEINGIFKTCCKISFLFFTKCRLFYDLNFFSSNITVSLYKPGAL
jgi:hypothetical protein